jgi:hypothetical protein
MAKYWILKMKIGLHFIATRSNGIRVITVDLYAHIPSRTQISGHRALISYVGQPITFYTRVCNSTDHLSQNCPHRYTNRTETIRTAKHTWAQLVVTEDVTRQPSEIILSERVTTAEETSAQLTQTAVDPASASTKVTQATSREIHAHNVFTEKSSTTLAKGEEDISTIVPTCQSDPHATPIPTADTLLAGGRKHTRQTPSKTTRYCKTWDSDSEER